MSMRTGRPRENFSLEKKFYPKLRETMNGCMEWTGKRSKAGYGKVYVGISENGKETEALAHRIAAKAKFGIFDESLCVLHKCDNPACCNPEHLFLGSRTDNARDRDSKGRQAKGPTHRSRTMPSSVMRCENHPNAKFTNDEVLIIRERYKNGESSCRIAKDFGVSHKRIWNIATGKGYSTL